MRKPVERPCGTILCSERGIALLLVLWLIVVLMVMAASLSFLTRTEVYSTLHFKEGLQKKYLAEAGVERGAMELMYRRLYRYQTVNLEGSEVMRVDGTDYTGELTGGKYTFRIHDEAGKININRLNDVSGIVLNNLLVNLGIPKEKADIIVDSILDWIDGDNLHRMNGAEDEYYMSLPRPYKAKNRPVETVEELLLVKGVTANILYGTKEQKGIIHFITVYGNATRININTAPKEVLMALPGVTEEMAQKVVDQRAGTEYKSPQEIMGIVAGASPLIQQYVDVMESNAYTIEAVGTFGDEKKGYGIRTIVVPATGGRKIVHVYYKSPAVL